jgi:hypothetical protein
VRDTVGAKNGRNTGEVSREVSKRRSISGQFDHDAIPPTAPGASGMGKENTLAHAENDWCIRVLIRAVQIGNHGNDRLSSKEGV